MDKAILVCVSYLGKENIELKGPKYDEINMKKLLTEKLGFKNVKIFSEYNNNPLPTRKNVIDELKKTDFKRLFFFYSGHGTRVKNRDEDEKENEDKDQTLCLLDGNFLDDEIYEIFSKYDKGQKVFSLSNSCYSGSISDLEFVYDDDFNAKGIKKRECKARIVQIGSSHDTKVSYEFTSGGILTQEFCKIVDKSDRITYYELLTQLRQKSKKYETPQITSSYKLDKDSLFFTQKSDRPFIIV